MKTKNETEKVERPMQVYIIKVSITGKGRDSPRTT